MNFTTDKLRSLARKRQALIEAHVDVKTTDNYNLRMFCIGFIKRRPNQVKQTCYAQSSQIRQIRRKMREIMGNQATSCDLKELVQNFIPEVIGKEIEKVQRELQLRIEAQEKYLRRSLKNNKGSVGSSLSHLVQEPDPHSQVAITHNLTTRLIPLLLCQLLNLSS